MTSPQFPSLIKSPLLYFRVLTRSILRLLAIAAMLLTFAPASVAQPRETLGAGDIVRITVFRNPDLTTDTRISDQGAITFPLIGEVQLAGLTPSEAALRIAEQLKQGKFVMNPEVNVAITQLRSRQVSVLGQVNKPGRYALDDANTKLTDILAVAGGMSAAGADFVTLVTTKDGVTQTTNIDLAAMVRNGDMSKNREIQTGDTIYVQRAPVFYIYGEVQRPGAYRLEPDMTLMQGLSLGGGLNPRGTERGIRIHRKSKDGTTRRIESALTDPLQADDVVYVKESLF